MKKVKKIITGMCLFAAITSVAAPVAAQSDRASWKEGWITTGTKSGYPYMQWQDYGRRLAGEVGVQDLRTGKNIDMKPGEATDYLYIEQSSKSYSETIYKGAYRRWYKN